MITFKSGSLCIPVCPSFVRVTRVPSGASSQIATPRDDADDADERKRPEKDAGSSASSIWPASDAKRRARERRDVRSFRVWDRAAQSEPSIRERITNARRRELDDGDDDDGDTRWATR